MNSIDLERRVAKLERSATRWRLLAIACALATAATLIVGVDRNERSLDVDTLITRSLVVKGVAGNTVASIDPNDAGGADLALYGGKDASRITIALHSATTGRQTLAITPSDPNSKAAILAVAGDKDLGLIVSDGSTHTRLAPAGSDTAKD